MERPMSSPEITQRAADVAAATSVGAAGISLSQINDAIGIVAGLVAVIAGIYSIWANRKKLKND